MSQEEHTPRGALRPNPNLSHWYQANAYCLFQSKLLQFPRPVFVWWCVCFPAEKKRFLLRMGQKK